MLSFIETNNRFIIEENRLFPDETLIVKYTKDLKFKRVNNDPWQKSSNNDIKWFNKYYERKFR